MTRLGNAVDVPTCNLLLFSFPYINRMASVEASHSAELKAVQQRIEAAESSLTLKEAELNRAREKVHSSYVFIR